MYKTNFLNAFLIVLFLMMIGEISYGQAYGKLYQKADAEQYYGTVAKSFQFSTEVRPARLCLHGILAGYI